MKSSLLPLHAAESSTTATLSSSSPPTYYNTMTLVARPAPRPHVAARLLQAYLHELDCRPLRTKCVSGMFVAMVCDILGQLISGSGLVGLNLFRTLAYVVYNAIIVVPVYHVAYNALESALPTQARDDGHGADGKRVAVWRHVVLQVVIDQLFLTPLAYVLYFFVYPVFELLRVDVVSSVEHLVRDLPVLLFANWAIYPVLQSFNFALVKPKLRVLVLLSFSFFAVTLQAVIAHRPLPLDDGATTVQHTVQSLFVHPVLLSWR